MPDDSREAEYCAGATDLLLAAESVGHAAREKESAWNDDLDRDREKNSDNSSRRERRRSAESDENENDCTTSCVVRDNGGADDGDESDASMDDEPDDAPRASLAVKCGGGDQLLSGTSQVHTPQFASTFGADGAGESNGVGAQGSRTSQQNQLAKDLGYEDLAKYFHLPITAAAVELGVCVTVLKKRCRRHGVRRWPHRKLKSLDKLKEKLEREEAVSTDKQYYQAEIHSIVQKKDKLFHPAKVSIRAPSGAGATSGSADEGGRPIVPGMMSSSSLPQARNRAMSGLSSAHAQPQEPKDQHTLSQGLSNVAVATPDLHSRSSPQPLAQSLGLKKSPSDLHGRAESQTQLPVEMAMQGHTYGHPSSHPPLQAFSQVHSGAHGQSPSLHQPPSQPALFGQQPTYYCGLYNCDCYLTGGVSTQGYHPPLPTLSARPPLAHYYPPTQQAHVPSYPYPYPPYHMTHPHSMLQVNLMEPTSSPPQPVLSIPAVSLSTGVPSLPFAYGTSAGTVLPPTARALPQIPDERKTAPARSGSVSAEVSPRFKKPDKETADAGHPTKVVSSNGSTGDGSDTRSVLRTGQPQEYPHHATMPLPLSQRPYQYEHATVMHPYWAEMTNSSVNPSNLVTLYNQTTHHHHHHAPLETSHPAKGKASNKAAAVTAIAKTSCVMAAPMSSKAQKGLIIQSKGDNGLLKGGNQSCDLNPTAVSLRPRTVGPSDVDAIDNTLSSKEDIHERSPIPTPKNQESSSLPACDGHARKSDQDDGKQLTDANCLVSDSDSENEKRLATAKSNISSLERSSSIARAHRNEKSSGELLKPEMAKEDQQLKSSTKKRPRSSRVEPGSASELSPSEGQEVRLQSMVAAGDSHASAVQNAQFSSVTGAGEKIGSFTVIDADMGHEPPATSRVTAVRGTYPIAEDANAGSTNVQLSRSALGRSVGLHQFTGPAGAASALEAEQARKCDLGVRGSSGTGNNILNGTATVNGTTCNGSVASHAKRYDHAVHLCSTLGVVMWSVDLNRKVTSAIGSKQMLGYAGVPSLGRSILDGTETSVESKRTIKERYAVARKGGRIDFVLSGPGGEQYLYILAPLRPRASSEITGVSGMLVKISGDTSRA